VPHGLLPRNLAGPHGVQRAVRAQPEVSWGDVWFNSLWNLLGPRTDKTFGEAKQKLFAAAPLSGARTPMHCLRTLAQRDVLDVLVYLQRAQHTSTVRWNRVAGPKARIRR